MYDVLFVLERLEGGLLVVRLMEVGWVYVYDKANYCMVITEIARGICSKIPAKYDNYQSYVAAVDPCSSID